MKDGVPDSQLTRLAQAGASKSGQRVPYTRCGNWPDSELGASNNDVRFVSPTPRPCESGHCPERLLSGSVNLRSRRSADVSDPRKTRVHDTATTKCPAPRHPSSRQGSAARTRMKCNMPSIGSTRRLAESAGTWPTRTNRTRSSPHGSDAGASCSRRTRRRSGRRPWASSPASRSRTAGR